MVTLIEPPGSASAPSLHRVAEPSTYLGHFDEIIEQNLTFAIVRILKQIIEWIGQVPIAKVLWCFCVDGGKVILVGDS
jgi:hypothetical protein